MSNYVVVDFGATTTRLAIASKNGQILDRIFYRTLLTGKPADTIRQLLKEIEDFLKVHKELNPRAISIGVPGTADEHQGTIVASTVLPGWVDVPIVEPLRDKFSLPVILENDGNLAGIGEYQFGIGKGKDPLIYINVSTGFGGALIVNGKLLKGNKGYGNEFGHVTVNAFGPKCSCGNYGCLQAVASGAAIASEARRRSDLLGEEVIPLFVSSNEEITTESIFQAATHGDKSAKEIIDQAAFYIGIGLISFINIFEPEMIILGGGVTKGSYVFLDNIKKTIQERGIKRVYSNTQIEISKLQDDAGLLGALFNAINTLD